MPSKDAVNMDAVKQVEAMLKLHQQIRANIEKQNERYMKKANQGRLETNFNFYLLKGRLSVADVIGSGGLDVICSKPDRRLKSWDSFIDLVNVLKHEIRDGQLSFNGKRVLELGCNYGLPGIFACVKGTSTVHFQDLSAKIIRCTTIPNVLSALEQVRDWQSCQPETLTPPRQALSPLVHVDVEIFSRNTYRILQ
ncbi:hypothetical protein MLD38_010938 [Melastoma candidum]|uniref:Uncharacterized protein n=1 Tax=Melastoma candidum TaxID=119954 RepID=A0ACB9R4J2_9MYRT|nr:hypothetical protein MLD38_010938 [Melastoma candidum]